jgi:hypothetical protein
MPLAVRRASAAICTYLRPLLAPPPAASSWLALFGTRSRMSARLFRSSGSSLSTGSLAGRIVCPVVVEVSIVVLTVVPIHREAVYLARAVPLGPGGGS